MTTLPTYDDVKTAAARLSGRAIRTPLLNSALLSEEFGADVYLKPENLQRTGSFKFRGAFNALSELGDVASEGVVAMSSGNHAQGVAEAARLFGVPATIVMPEDAPQVKRARAKGMGATIVTYERGREDREEVAAGILERQGGSLVHPFNDPAVIAGQGTIGLEIAADCEREGIRPDLVLICCGGGGLMAGTSLGLSKGQPDAAIYGVEPEGFDDYGRSLAAGELLSNTRHTGSVCDALLSDTPGAIGFEINRKRVSGMLTVTDDEALEASGYAYEWQRMVVEPGGAVALAALRSGKVDVAGKSVVVVLSGGNIDDAVLARARSVFSDFLEAS